MKRKTIFALAVLSVTALVAVAPAFAQDRFGAKIPFAFNVGSKSLPSGNYEVGKMLGNTLVIQNTATHQAAIAITTAASPKQIQGDAVVLPQVPRQELPVRRPGRGQPAGPRGIQA